MTGDDTSIGDSHWARPQPAQADPNAALRAELARLSGSVGSLERVSGRLQVTMVVVTLALGLFLPFARTDAGGRDDLPTDHHLLGLFGLLFKPDLAFVGGTHDSSSAGLGRMVMLIGIGLVLVGVLVAIGGLGSVIDTAPRRSSVLALRWGGIVTAVGLVVTALGGLVLSWRTDITVVTLGFLFMIITAVLVLTAAADARGR